MMEESIKELISEYLPELLREKLSIQIDIRDEPYHNEYKNFKVTIEYDGEEISTYTDSVRISECNCGGC